MEAAGVTLKLKELFAGVKICCQLHATYEDFDSLLAKALDKAFHATPSTDVARRRFLLRFCVELILVECIPKTSSPLLPIVKELSDISLAEEQVVINFTILVSVVQKHATSVLNVVPTKQKAYEEALGRSWVERQCTLDDQLRSQLTHLIVNAYQGSAAGLLQSAHVRLLEQEKVNSKLRVDKGQVDAENEQKHQQLKEMFTKLQGNLAILSEFLNQPLPVPQEDNPSATRLAGAGKKEENQDDETDDTLMLWEDAEQQRFYEEVLDCKAVIPAVLLGLDKSSPAVVVAPSNEGATEDEKDPKAEAKEEDGKPHLAASDLDLYLLRVAKADNSKQIDDLIHEFFHEHNTKGSRRALAAQLLDMHRALPHLLPARARFVATVAPYLKEVPTYILAGLQHDLEQVIADKNPGELDGRIKTVRYLCELCKFKVCPPGVIIDTLKQFCDDFSQHHAELCSHILQCCGRFLLYTPETATRTGNLVERMMRLKNVKSLPLRIEILLEDAYYQLKPPEGKRKKMRDKSNLELFTQHLIYERLYSEEDEDAVLRLVRKLPWSDQAPKWIKKCILELNLHANYETIYHIASLLSGLAKYRDAFVIDVIDSLFENIQTSIERNDFREAPLRVRQIKLLGELYNYRLVDSSVVFDMMYHLIGFGGPTMHRAGQAVTAHKVLERALAVRKAALGSISEEGGAEEVASGGGGMQLPPVFADPQHPMEAPWDFFRIKLVCVLLETCGHYFDRGAVKQKLDRFLNFFMRYVITKGDLPLRITYMVGDMLERLRPKLVVQTDLAKMDKIIIDILKNENVEKSTPTDEKERQDDEGQDEDESSEDSDSSETDSSDESGESEEDSGSEDDDEESDDDHEDYVRGDEASKRQHDEFDEFDREVQQMLIDSLEKEKNAPRAPAELPTPPTIAKRQEGDSAEQRGFSLLQKKTGGKVLLKSIDVPQDSKLARATKPSNDVEASREKEENKRFIIQFDQMSSTVGDTSAPIGGLGIGGNSRGPVQIQLRAGKGGHRGIGGKSGSGSSGAVKGGRGGPGSRRDGEYLKGELLPEDSQGAKKPESGPVLLSRAGCAGKGSGGGAGVTVGKSGGGPIGGAATASRPGAKQNLAGKTGSGGGTDGHSSSGRRRQTDQSSSRGTPGTPQNKGSL
eukprot:TRINITY_DN61869_c0_g1_i1.p1 TRINITY_DN61869_c0_g1~~TRINITY_DN61869_c0_g1_i1.p1  ORF type:complete len:1314 (+),score=281.66 TRINITY_DN61869_c0_g1_i1:502-3942(+)